MAAVFAGRERVESAIASSRAVSVAAINGPETRRDFRRRESSRDYSQATFRARESKARTWPFPTRFIRP